MKERAVETPEEGISQAALGLQKERKTVTTAVLTVRNTLGSVRLRRHGRK